MRGIIFFLAAAVVTPGNAPKQTFESYQAAAEAANSALTNADYESAEVSLRKAIRLGPQNPGVVYHLRLSKRDVARLPARCRCSNAMPR